MSPSTLCQAARVQGLRGTAWLGPVLLPPPGKLIVVQMEQVRASRWVDEAYMARMHASLAVLDYSRDNIAALTERGLPFKQMYFVPIRPLRRAAPHMPCNGGASQRIEQQME